MEEKKEVPVLRILEGGQTVPLEFWLKKRTDFNREYFEDQLDEVCIEKLCDGTKSAQEHKKLK